MRDNAERLVRQRFTGITTDANIIPGLFQLSATGVSTDPIRRAAIDFLDALNSRERQHVVFDTQVGPVAALVEYPPVPHAPWPAAGE